MLHFVKGTLAMNFAGGVVIETGGIGYEIYVPDNSSVYLAKEGQQVMIFTAMIVREDDISIYGFTDKESLQLFRKLMTVNGVGAKAALSILSTLPVQELQKAIAFEDVTVLTKANGIGKKIAQRIVLELKDKLDVSGVITGSGLGDFNTPAISEKGEAVNALMSLGYSKAEAVDAVAAIDEKDLTVEVYIKKALKRLG